MRYRIIGKPFSDDGVYRYFYLIHNSLDDGYYYGIHTTKKLDDGYKGSGKRLLNSIKKYGDEYFTKYILEFFSNKEDMLKRESEVVNEELLKDPLCYNLILGGATNEATFNKTYVVDENNNKICVSKDDPNIGIKYFNINKNKVVVKDKSNNNYSVSKDDPRIKTGEFIPINTGFTIVKDKYGNRYRVFKDDPRIKTGEFVGISEGYVCMKDINGKNIKVKCDDPRIKTGELISVVKDTVSVEDSNGNRYRVAKNDPRIKTGELKYHTQNRMTVVDKYGNTQSVYIDDPRIKTGELISINKSRIYINNGQINKMVYDYELDEYLNTGWVKGMHRFK